MRRWAADEQATEALEALVGLADRDAAAGAAAEAIAARLDDDPDHTADRPTLIAALGTLHHVLGATSLVRLVVSVAAGKEAEAEAIAPAAIDALRAILVDRTVRPQNLPDGRTRARYRETHALTYLGEAARSPLASVRAGVARTLGDVDDRAAEDILGKLLTDRDPEVRVAAAEALALRAEYVPTATLAALEAALRGGRRELVLPAALGLAARKRPEAFQPLLLVIKAGEPEERERALLALGALGDRRALDELVPLLDPAPENEADRVLTPAAVEALGRLLPSLQGDEAVDIRGRLERLALTGAGPARLRALTGLRYAGQLGIVQQVAVDREARTDVRVHAIAQLGLARDPATETALAELLSDDDYGVREAAVAALTKVLRADRTRVSLHALASPHDHISAPAARYLSAAGDAATLVERFGSVKSADVRKMLREGLIRRGELPRPQLEAALRGADPRPRAEAAWLAGYGGTAAAPLADAVAAAVARGEAGWRTADGGARGGKDLLADEALAWRASLWAAGRVGAAATVDASAASAVGNDRAPVEARREAARVLAVAGSATALAKAVGDRDREIRAVASHAVAERQPATAATVVRSLGARADATTIAPLANVAWAELAAPLVADAGTRAWTLTVALASRKVAELVAIASAPGEDPARFAAIAALGRIAGDDAKVALERIHHSESEPDAVKLAAWKALKRLLRAGGKTYAEGVDKGGGDASTGGGGEDEDAGDEDEDAGDDDDDDDEGSGDDDDEEGGGDEGGGDDDDDDDDEEEDDDDGDDDDE